MEIPNNVLCYIVLRSGQLVLIEPFGLLSGLLKPEDNLIGVIVNEGGLPIAKVKNTLKNTFENMPCK